MAATESELSLRHASWLEIDLSRLDANVAAWRRLLARPPVGRQARAVPPRLCAVVKADAYGLGAVPIARRLQELDIDMMAVYSPVQARELVEAGITTPLLLLMPVRQLDEADPLAPAARAGQLHFTANDLRELAELDAAGRSVDAILPVHLYLDTGMCRGGLVEDDLEQAGFQVSRLPNLRLAGLCTHFAAPSHDPAFTSHQFDRFREMLAGYFAGDLGDVTLHAAGTYAALRDTRYHGDMVRIGLGLYGYGPDMMRHRPVVEPMPNLQPIVRWLSSIVQVQRFEAGRSVGYDRTHRLTRNSVLGLVPAGYADGYPLSLTNKPTVAVSPAPGEPKIDVPVIGKINMDQVILDLTDTPFAQSAQAVGMTVELISNDSASACALPRLAQLANSNCYEMLCRLSTRLPRVYLSADTSATSLLRRSIQRVSDPKLSPARTEG